MSTLRIRDCDIHYEERGTGEPFVFSHGLLWSTDMFAEQIAVLSDRYRCIAYDHRGQGKSQIPPETSIGMDGLYEDAAELIERLDAKPCHFLGLSMGGFVALRLAARKPELVRSLILMETSADPEPSFSKVKYTVMSAMTRAGLLKALVGSVMQLMFGKTFLNDPARAAQKALWRQKLSDLDRRIYRAANGVIDREGVYDELSAIKCPTLIIVGEEDVSTPLIRARRMHEGIPHSKLVVVPKAGHTSTVEAPAAVNDAIETFLKEVEQSTP